MSQAIVNPFPMYFDRRGRPLTGGKVWIGVVGEDPELNPIGTFYDINLEIEAEQPINVIGGMLVRDGNPARIFVGEEQYSIRVRDGDGQEVFYLAAAVMQPEQFQPLDADLSAIAALATSAYGRTLLTLANASALRAYAGVVDPLPIAGGTMTGEILRDEAGAYVYMADEDYPQARIFVTENGASDPRTLVGDIWLEEVAP